jgi:hypothetical protein
MQFIDAAAVEHPRLTGDGYLVADARIVRTGIQHYAGFEVGKPEMQMVRVYRPEEEVFHRDSLASFSHVPITDDHPSEAVTADNWSKLAKGETGDEVLRDGQRLRIPLIVKDAAAVKAIQGGKRELSAGYTCDLSFEDGVTPNGEAYDAIQRNIRANHLAIVQRGRAGSECRIGDGAASWGAAPITIEDKDPPMTLKTVTVDGIPIEVTDQGATVIATLQQRLSDSAANIAKLNTDHAAALAAKDAEIAAKDAALDDAKGKILSDADIDKRVQDRGDLVALAGAIAKDVKTTGVSDADIRKAVVVAKLGDAAVEGKSAAYIDARFDILAEDAKKGSDVVRKALGDKTPPSINDNGQSAYEARLSDAWKKEA